MPGTSKSEEMVTEICPGDDHPFPIPEKLMPRIRELRGHVREPMAKPGQPTFSALYGKYGPEFFSAWETSIIKLGGVSAALDHMGTQLPDCPEKNIIKALSMGLEREIFRLQAIWEWARATWKYDPVVRAAMNQETDAGSEESTPSSEAPALQ